MGRWGPLSLDSDAAQSFISDDFSLKNEELDSVNDTWDFFFQEWKALSDDQKEEWGFEYLFSVIELWVLKEQRDSLIESTKELGDEEADLKKESDRILAFLEKMKTESLSKSTCQNAIEVGLWGEEFWKRVFSRKELSEKEIEDRDTTLLCVKKVLQILENY